MKYIKTKEDLIAEASIEPQPLDESIAVNISLEGDSDDVIAKLKKFGATVVKNFPFGILVAKINKNDMDKIKALDGVQDVEEEGEGKADS